MDIQFSARHFNASAGLQDRIQEEMDKLAKFTRISLAPL